MVLGGRSFRPAPWTLNTQVPKVEMNCVTGPPSLLRRTWGKQTSILEAACCRASPGSRTTDSEPQMLQATPTAPPSLPATHPMGLLRCFHGSFSFVFLSAVFNERFP